MKIRWKFPLGLPKEMWYDYRCDFFIHHGAVIYAHRKYVPGNKNNTTVFTMGDTIDSVVSKSIMLDHGVLLPHAWKIFVREDRLILYTGRWLDITDSEIAILPDDVKLDYKLPEKYIFDDKQIVYNGRMIVECICQKTGNLLWKHRIKGYIYTRIEELVKFHRRSNRCPRSVKLTRRRFERR
jgi:hypothetical protein